MESTHPCPKLISIMQYLDSLRGRADLGTLEKILTQTDIISKDVLSSCRFQDNHYARNKIAGSEWYDFYIMCWKPGQASAIHDHTDSSCAFRILEGVATEIACELTDSQNRYVRKTQAIEYRVGQLCVAQDNNIHQIANTSNDQNLVTMHIYSPPLKMSVYEIDPNEDCDLAA